MATTVVMPRQGQTVESCIIVEWKKAIGDSVAEGEVLLEVETDKATLEVPAPVSGTLLARFFEAGDEVPVLTAIASIGAPGEEISGAPGLPEPPKPEPDVPVESEEVAAKVQGSAPAQAPAQAAAQAAAQVPSVEASGGASPVSPRARHVAERKGVDAPALQGSGPGGRVIERDVLAAAAAMPKLTPVARAMVAEGGYTVPAQGSGPRGRVTSHDLVQQAAPQVAAAPAAVAAPAPVPGDEVERIEVKGVRKIIAERMLQSLQTTAQLTMNASADARALQAYRARLKQSPEALGLRGVTINDLVLFAVSRALLQHPEVNALYLPQEAAILRHRRVHLAFAVDTPRGLIVPVIRNADSLSLRRMAADAKRLATAAQENKSAPDDLTGGTFTVTNLGGFGVESFTPVLNPPQVGILGVGNIQPRPVQGADGIDFVPHLGLSLTINHQVVDGAPGARFLQTLAALIAQFDLLLAG